MIDEKKLLSDIEKEMNTAITMNLLQKVAGIHRIKRIVQSQPEVNRWIPVSERLPEEEGYYLVYDENHQIIIEWRYVDKDTEWNNPYFTTDYNILAWQPLPEPYKEENYD